MKEIKENKQKNNDPDFGLQDYLGEKIENTIFRIHAKNNLNHDISSDSSSENAHIHYYENFLKSLKNENENQKQEKKIKKYKNKNSLKLKIEQKEKENSQSIKVPSIQQSNISSINQDINNLKKIN